MNNIVQNLVIAALVLLNVASASANKTYTGPDILVKQNVKIVGEFYLNKTTKMHCTITSPVDVPEMRFTIKSRSAEVIGPKEILASIKANVPHTVDFFVLPNADPLVINVKSIGRAGDKSAGATFRIQLVLVDEKTGRFGSRDEKKYSKKTDLHILRRYDYNIGEWTKKPNDSFMGGNYTIICSIRKLEPSITDSEALCLHADLFKIGLPYKDDPNGKAVIIMDGTESEQYKCSLGNGWLKAFRMGKRGAWIKENEGRMRKTWIEKNDSRNDPRFDENNKYQPRLGYS